MIATETLETLQILADLDVSWATEDIQDTMPKRDRKTFLMLRGRCEFETEEMLETA